MIGLWKTFDLNFCITLIWYFNEPQNFFSYILLGTKQNTNIYHCVKWYKITKNKVCIEMIVRKYTKILPVEIFEWRIILIFFFFYLYLCFLNASHTLI